ncbi:MAG: hypothetical protein AAB131_08875 [Actinomycetota bacterium]
MSELPQPPMSAHSGPVATSAQPQRVGQLAAGWRVTFALGWCGVLLGFAAVAKTARTMGLSTWWLGASAEPRFVLIQVVPFVPGVLLVTGAMRNARFLPYVGIIGAIALAAVATGDVGRFDRLALVQFVIAGGGMAVSVASFAGMLRRDRY